MVLGYSELSASSKVLPTVTTTSTEGGMNTKLTADSNTMKGGKKGKRSQKKSKKVRKSRKQKSKSCKSVS